MSQPSQLESLSVPDHEDFEKLVLTIANFFIQANCSKIPVKRADLSKHIPRKFSRMFDRLIKETSKHLEMAFGYKIVQSSDDKQSYILVSNLQIDAEIESRILSYNDSPKEVTLSLLRNVILTAIFMSGGVIQEGTLKEYLNKLGLDMEEKHPLLGDIQKLISTEFVRQCYIEIKVSKEVDNCPKEYRWGSRAEKEIDKRTLLDFVSKIYGEKCHAEMWTEQFKQIKSED